MDSLSTEVVDERMLAETPEDVAVLYSWANLQGAKYRDFSASRREYRALMRHRQAEQLREEEMRAKGEAEAAASEAERAAREAEEEARFHEKEAKRRSQDLQIDESRVEEQAKTKAQRHAVELNRIAAVERVEVARRAEAVAAAEAVARREEREMAEAQASAARQAARYQESESRRRTLAGPQPSANIPGEISDPYMTEPASLPGRLFHQPEVHGDTMQPTRHAPSREARLLIPQADPRDDSPRGKSARDSQTRERDRHQVKEYWVTGTTQEEAGIAATGAKAIERDAHASNAHVSYYYDPNPQERAEAVDRYAEAVQYADRPSKGSRTGVPVADPYADRVVEVERPAASPRDSRVLREHQAERTLARGSSAARAGVFDPQRPSVGSIYGLSGVVRSQKSNSKHERVRPVGAGEGAPLYDPIPGSPRPESAAVRRAPRIGSVESAKYLATPATGFPREFTRSRPARGYRPDEASGVHDIDSVNDSEERAGSVPAWISSEVVPAAREGQAIDALKPMERATSSRASDRQAAALYRGEEWNRATQADTRGLEPESSLPGGVERVSDFAPRRDEAREDVSREGVSGSFAAYQEADARKHETRAYDSPRLDAARAAEVVRPTSEPREQHRSSVVRRAGAPQQASAVVDTLQHSRERVAARWYALKGVFDHAGQEQQAKPSAPQVKSVPMVGMFSLAGGTGKTSLVATLGRALSASGEKVLLTDMTSHGLLPFYFGASELKAGVVRTFSPPPGSADAAIALVCYDAGGLDNDAARESFFKDELARKGSAMQRIVLDISAASPWVVQRMAKLGATVVVPVSPDMNSVISLGAVEKFFTGIVDQDGRAVQPYYLLNQFDAALPLHLDVREVMKQQLGDRLLPFVIRRSPVVSEALAEGMTVIDYAPESPAAGDYMNLAQWLRMQSSPAAAAANKNVRWSER